MLSEKSIRRAQEDNRNHTSGSIPDILKNVVADYLNAVGRQVSQDGILYFFLRQIISYRVRERKGSVNGIFTDVRNKVKSAVAVAPSADVLGVVPMISNGKLTDTEIQIFLDTHNNYMDKKLIYTAMGKGLEFQTVENILNDLDTLQAGVEEYFKTYQGESLEKMSYNNARVMFGSLVEDTYETVNTFLNTYGEQDSES